MASSFAAAHRRLCPRVKVVTVVGATGCGKSRLSIDVASHFTSEVINSDKMQLYRGLDITTNKIPLADRRGVRHHLLSSFDPNDGEMSPSQFRFHGDAAISGVASRGKLPLLVGGSNSFIHALLADRFDPEADPFGRLGSPASPKLRYDCCFLKRDDDPVRQGAYKEAVWEIKKNACQLAKRQIEKIQRLRGRGWELRKLDATEVVQLAMAAEEEGGSCVRWQGVWNRQVVGQSLNIVRRFLRE
ncbi:hypothetical protein EUGRSUZ_C02674 [Eucalyptus grandis]|uniref:Uncharacterized protein n=2 Tax=Eucalyptus grandis TaxID=71139 RepID=A0ACC3LI23_EUCGR|nr:hypothetical protein EUGRSUZ_C02674 [Eucalyptus grandis]